MGSINPLTWVRKQVRDHWRHDRYLSLSWIVPRPDMVNPRACILITLSTGPGHRVMFRVPSLAAYDEAVSLTSSDRRRLTAQLAEARNQVAELTEAERLGYLRAQGLLARTDTGELVPPTGSLRPGVLDQVRDVVDNA